MPLYDPLILERRWTNCKNPLQLYKSIEIVDLLYPNPNPHPPSSLDHPLRREWQSNLQLYPHLVDYLAFLI
jgi:mRNA-degrading endonuclease YafQ of YafQ-DinJ toxin-antitoxin module